MDAPLKKKGASAKPVALRNVVGIATGRSPDSRVFFTNWLLAFPHRSAVASTTAFDSFTVAGAVPALQRDVAHRLPV